MTHTDHCLRAEMQQQEMKNGKVIVQRKVDQKLNKLTDN